MWTHYLKIAWRNLLKYKVQTAVCVCGLAVGFICFALSLLWVRHETTFDQVSFSAVSLQMLSVSPVACTSLLPIMQSLTLALHRFLRFSYG